MAGSALPHFNLLELSEDSTEFSIYIYNHSRIANYCQSSCVCIFHHYSDVHRKVSKLLVAISYIDTSFMMIIQLAPVLDDLYSSHAEKLTI